MSKAKPRNIVITKAVNFAHEETQSLDVLHKQAITSLRSITRQIRALKLASDKFPAIKLSTSLESSIKDWSNTSSGEKSSLLKNKSSDTPDEFDDDAWTASIPELTVINLRRSLKLDVSCQQSIQELVNCLRDWRMELEDAKYKDTDFDAPLIPWSKKDKMAMKDEITAISLEERKKNIANKLNKANQYQRDNKGNPARMNLVKQMVDLLVQEIFLLRIMPFEEVVYPVNVKDVYCWERVSKALNGSHTPAECSEFWYTKFHPRINGKSWSEAENKALVALTEEFNMQHWDKVAKFLYSGRTPYQCYVQFRRFLYKQKPFGKPKQNNDEKKGVDIKTKLTDVVDATMTAITTVVTHTTKAVNAKNATSATDSANAKDAKATPKAKGAKRNKNVRVIKIEPYVY